MPVSHNLEGRTRAMSYVYGHSQVTSGFYCLQAPKSKLKPRGSPALFPRNKKPHHYLASPPSSLQPALPRFCTDLHAPTPGRTAACYNCGRPCYTPHLACHRNPLCREPPGNLPTHSRAVTGSLRSQAQARFSWEPLHGH